MLRSRRRASSASSASSRVPSASASLAATKAFLRDRESNGALSSAAAAAALRTHPATPTPVGDTVTKRMVRKASVSSHGSASQQPPALRRHSSSGSMTERSFRAPSPSRSSPVDPNAPPVPAVPKIVAHRRNSSLEPPARGASPVGRGGGRGVSLDRGTSTPSNRGRGQPRASALAKVVEDEQDAGHRSSINFSRPISPPAAPSPTPRPVASARDGQSGWFSGPVVNSEQTFRGEKPRPKTAEGPSAHGTRQAAQNVQNAADSPVSTRATHMSSGVEGARLATGSMRAKPSGTAAPAQQTYGPAQNRPVRVVDPNSPFAVYDPSSRKFIHKQDAMNLHRAMSDAADPAPPYEPRRVPHQTHHEPPQYNQPTGQAAQVRNTAQRSPSASPVRDAPRPAKYTRQDAGAHPGPASSASHRGVASSRYEPVAFIPQGLTKPEDENTSRKLESPAPEPVEELEETASPKLPPNQDSSYPRLAPPDSRTPSGPPSTQGSERSARTHSMSPPRNAHFAALAADLSNGIKHQPPGRSVSPAKSALKASSSVSGRSHSPLANNGPLLNRGVPSEVSDVVSEDGGKKKKKVRISFEEEPTVVGTSAYSHSQPVADDDSEEDLDDILKPTPILPSFGSIRDTNRRSRDDLEKVTETVSSSLSNSATLMGESTEMSRDHKIGAILAQNHAATSAEHPSGNDPLPPEVTSVEGSGYYSESSESEVGVPIIDHQETRKPGLLDSTPAPEPKTLTSPIEMRSSPLEVPTIAVQPASPPLPRDSETEPTFNLQPVPFTPVLRAPRPFVPGGWDDDDASEPELEAKAPEPSVSAPSPSSITIQIPERPVDDESSDDNSSVYSDAYEDLDEGEGFGSIDAIMESPVVAPTSRFESPNSSPTARKTGLENSRCAPTNSEDIQEGVIQEQRKAQDDDWEKSQQHWSDLHNARKQQPKSGLLIDNPVTKEEPRSVSQAAVPVTQARAKAKHSAQQSAELISAKPKDRRVTVEPTVVPAQAPPTQPTKAPAQPRKSALKKTTPTSLPAEIPMKKTMRGTAPSSNGAESQMRTTMRGTGGGFAGRGSSAPATQRRSMPPMDTRPPRGALQKKHLPAAAAGAATRSRPQSASGLPAKPKYVAPAAPAYDSDSDASVSSFQRERQRNRASRNNNGGQYTMRASMRSGPTPTMRAAPPVRSISPPRTVASPPPSTLRKSMRPSSPTPESPSTVKSSRFSIRSLSPAGRFRRSSTYEPAPPMPPLPVQAPPPKVKKAMFGKPAPAKAPVKKAAKPFRSRINDSSDEDEDVPRRFQSRFADSDSEDDEDFELPPVRGIPKRPGKDDGDSTDLEEELSDNEPSPAPVTNGNDKGKGVATNGLTNAQGATLAAASLRKPGALPSIEIGQKKAKRGFFGFGKKKNPTTAEAQIHAQTAADLGIPMPPTQQNRDRNRPLTPIGEDRDTDAGNVTTLPPQAVRRTPLERSTSDSWPLPSPNPAFAGDQRPLSADGPLTQRLSSARPTLVKRNPSQISQARTEIDPKTGKDVSFGKSGKKKKFQGLRRVLRLND